MDTKKPQNNPRPEPNPPRPQAQPSKPQSQSQTQSARQPDGALDARKLNTAAAALAARLDTIGTKFIPGMSIEQAEGAQEELRRVSEQVRLWGANAADPLPPLGR